MIDKWKGRLWLAVYILTLCFAYVFVITLVPWAKQNDMITGVLIGTGVGGVIGFFFGSSDKKGKEDSYLNGKPPEPVIDPERP